MLTSREAAALIAENGDDPENYLQDPEACRLGILRALKRTHPDHGRTADDLYVVQAARDVLGNTTELRSSYGGVYRMSGVIFVGDPWRGELGA